MAGWAGLAIVTATVLRWRYQTAITVNTLSSRAAAVPGRAWVQTYWTGPHGQPVSPDSFRLSLLQQKSRGPVAKTLVERLAQRGYHEWISYQPESRFWHFQLIEAGWLLALALLLGVATVWLVRHRAA
jgi:hypothetical protein